MDSSYSPPLALTIISGTFLALGAVFASVLIADIVWRKGWRSMMWIMIPVYPINAAYMGPLTLYLYFRFGRAKKLEKWAHGGDEERAEKADADPSGPANLSPVSNHGDGDGLAQYGEKHESHGARGPQPGELRSQHPHPHSHQHQHQQREEHEHNHDMHMSQDRPMWATVLIGVSHCGAGCVLGDLVGEWLVYGTGVSLAGEMLWPSMLIDYAFALLFGIVFQYFSIAPMSGDYGPKTVVRAAKADILSLTAFEIGLFGWMAAYQVGIWGYELNTNTWVYWWMMQVGMILGFVTAVPVNWWLIGTGIKEPCA